MTGGTRLSLLIPVFNERQTLPAALLAASQALAGIETELVVVDDGSTDGSREWLAAAAPGGTMRASGFTLDAAGMLRADPAVSGPGVTLVVEYHAGNRGKGAAVRTALARASGGVVAIQDADLEYDPADLLPMYRLIACKHVADAVFGSRFYGKPHRSLFFHHYAANRLLSLLFNVLYNQTLTDIECCYKVMRTDVARSLGLCSDDFGIEIELCAGVARRRGLRIYEIGVSYFGRTYAEGKKIGWRDGVKAFWYLVKFRIRPKPRA